MNEWNDLFVATAGAAAALTGLIFVGVSISLHKILSIGQLADRALISLVLLMSILVISVMMLIPGLLPTQLGILCLVIGILIWGLITFLDVRIYTAKDKLYKPYYRFTMLVDQLAVLPYVLSAIVIIVGHTGLYWLTFAILVSFVKAVSDAWVLLIEINR